jgi:hypothetical protein
MKVEIFPAGLPSTLPRDILVKHGAVGSIRKAEPLQPHLFPEPIRNPLLYLVRSRPELRIFRSTRYPLDMRRSCEADPDTCENPRPPRPSTSRFRRRGVGSPAWKHRSMLCAIFNPGAERNRCTCPVSVRTVTTISRLGHLIRFRTRKWCPGLRDAGMGSICKPWPFACAAEVFEFCQVSLGAWPRRVRRPGGMEVRRNEMPEQPYIYIVIAMDP